MKNQKIKLIPKVGALPVTEWNAATSFTSEFIEFPESKEWCLDVQGYSEVVAGAPTISILMSNEQDGEYKEYDSSTLNIDITVSGNRLIYDAMFPGRFMKIQYVSGGSTGDFSLILSK